ncbi:uncharacterized protein EV420DRAFT_1723707, partial [Desarmillaria tabescens]
MYFSLAFILSGFVLISPVLSEEVCPGQVTLSESYIGADKNVKVETVSCPEGTLTRRGDVVPRQAPVTNVCGAQCNTLCFTPSGGGPNPNECHVIADALRYEGRNIGNLFNINNGTTGNVVVMTYSSCLSFFANKINGVMQYCRNDWASAIDWVAPNCQSTQNAHGGDCLASDGRWFIQVQHS